MFDEDLVEKEKLCNRLSGDAFYYIKSSDVGGQIKATETERQRISQYRPSYLPHHWVSHAIVAVLEL